MLQTQKRSIACLVVVAMLLSEQSLQAQDVGASNKLGNQYLPLDGIAVVEVNPAKVMTSEATALYPLEIAEAWCLDNIGFSPKACDSIRVVSAMPGPSGPMAGVIVKLNEAFPIANLNAQLVRADETIDVDGFACLPINGPPGVVVHQPDPQTIVIASQNYLQSVMNAAGGNQSGQLSKLASAVTHDGQLTILFAIEPVRPMVNGMVQAFANQLPPPLAQFAELPNLLDALLIQINLEDDKGGARIVFLAVDDAAAEKIELMLADAMQMGRQIAMAQFEQNMREEGPVPDATRAYAERMADRVTAMLKPRRDGRRLVLSASPNQGLAAQAMLMAMVMPAVQGARFAARGQQAQNNLKQIGLAMHNFHSAYRKLPDAISRDADGKALLSWRVHVLPFLDEAQLYGEFRLDEPWDSEHNIKLLPRMPAVYQHASIQSEPNTTVYQLPIGDGTMFNAEEATRFRDVLDGLSNTIMVVESDAASAVPWTKPQDLSIDADDPDRSIGFQGNLTNVLLGDGSVRVFDQDTEGVTWNSMLSRAGRD
ncbi:MAG: DUF1559 domain-containing protein [Pirellulaceae bacterium]